MTSLEHAAQLFHAGRVDDAAAACRAFLRKAPKHPGALHLAGLCAARRGDRTAAIELIERAVAAAPAYGEAHYDLGNLYVRAGPPEAAEKAFRRVVALAPSFAPAHNNLGVLLRRAARHDEAIAVLTRAVALDPSHGRFRKNLGDAYWSAGREAEATPHHDAALELWTDAPDAAFFEHVWMSLTARGERDRARAVAAKWLAGDPANPIAQHCLAASTGRDAPLRASDGYVRSTFDTLAATFDERLADVGYQGPALVIAALSRANDELVPAVLDAGCGTGLCGAGLRPLATRLVGVDLSSKMLERAAARGVYDELVEAELTAYLESHELAFDRIASADTLIYFGELTRLLGAMAKALRPGGLVALSAEKRDDADAQATFVLEEHGRYSHGRGYLTDALRGAGFGSIEVEEAVLREEHGTPVAGLIVTARKEG